MSVSRKDSRGYALRQNEFERPKGKGYEFRWYDSITGKHRSINAPTLEKLREREKDVLRDIVDGVRSDKEITLNHYFQIWRNLKTGLKPNTKTNYVYMYMRFVYDTLGKKRLRDLKYSDIVAFYKKLTDEGKVGISTLDTLHNVIHPALTMAVNDNVIRRNVSDGALKDLKAHAKEMSRCKQLIGQEPISLTPDEQKRLLEYVKGTRWEPIVRFMLLTGLRIGELGALSWDDIDEVRKCIHIRKTLVHDKDLDTKLCIRRMNTTKYDASFRELPLNPELLDILRLQKEVGFQNKDDVDGFSGFVFSTRYGTCVNQQNVNNALRRIQRNANADPKANTLLPAMTTHKMRKTYATNMIRAGVEVTHLMALLGHNDPKVTLQYYVEAQLDMKLEADRKMREQMKKNKTL